MKNITLFIFLLFFTIGYSQTLPLDFESSTVSYAFTNFDGGSASVVSNPNSGTINTSAKVAKMIKGTGQPWAGSKIQMGGAIDFTTKKVFKVKVFSPVAGKKLLLKFEGAGAAFEKESTPITTANVWEELTFDFTLVGGVNNLNDNIVFIFDLGTAGDGSANSTYYFDDVAQSAAAVSSLTQMTLPVTFDTATVNYGLIGFGGAESSSIVEDPTLSSNKVAKVIKSATAELWAGVTVTVASPSGFFANIPFSGTETKMNVRVWSPNAGIPVRLKVEDKNDPTRSCETEAQVSTAAGWQTLEFNFANQASGTAALNLAFAYNKASIFFNFGTTGAVAGEKTYYFDDMKFGASTLAVANFDVNSSLKMYPNPVSNVLTIEANGTIEKVGFYSVLGQEVLVKNSKSNTATLQTNELSKGVYIVRTTIDGKVSTRKLIKE